MPTIQDAHSQRWSLLSSRIPFNPDSAFAKYFMAHPEIGSPIGVELSLDDGSVAQAFSGGVLQWSGGDSVAVVSG